MNAAVMADPRRKYGPPEYLHRVVKGMTREMLAHQFAQLAGEKGFVAGAEIGVADGRYSRTLMESIPGLRLWCVDPWRPYSGNRRGGPLEQHERNFLLAGERLAAWGDRVCFMRSMSCEAAAVVPVNRLDFVYIDGNHAYEYVAQDVALWADRVRPGGIVAGHDFYHFQGAGVVEAVTEYTQAHEIADWWLTDEREPSFWWVKR